MYQVTAPPVIDPKSTAGVLLREHDNPMQALRYAERKAAALLAMHNTIGLDYAQAADDLRRYIRSRATLRACAASQPQD